MQIFELMDVVEEERDPGWLAEALQAAVELEFFTIPPYLTALWSIKDEAGYAAQTIREVVYEEMQHMALACNMLVAIGGTPKINDPRGVPKYPGPLPGGVRTELTTDEDGTVRAPLSVGLSGLTRDAVKIFMEIERPKNPIEFRTVEAGFEAVGRFATIGDFYKAISAAFETLKPPISVDKQISGPLAPLVIEDLDSVQKAIHLIQAQGEGTEVSPLGDAPPEAGQKLGNDEVIQAPAGPSLKAGTAPDLAHYYRFQEIDKGRKLRYQEATHDFRWAEPLPFPEAFPVAAIPEGGHVGGALPPAVRADLLAFDRDYSAMLDDLQSAWVDAGQDGLWRAVAAMFSLRDRARALMQVPIPGGCGNYGPCFRYVERGKHSSDPTTDPTP